MSKDRQAKDKRKGGIEEVIGATKKTKGLFRASNRKCGIILMIFKRQFLASKNASSQNVFKINLTIALSLTLFKPIKANLVSHKDKQKYFF